MSNQPAFVVCVLGLVLAGCSADKQGTAFEPRRGQSYPTPDEPTHGSVTVLNHGDGRRENVGVKQYRDSTLWFVKNVPLSALQVDDRGRMLAFSPARPPAPGVTPPPAGTAIKSLKFDRQGRLVAWEPAETD